MNIRVTKTTHPMELTPSDKLGFGIHYTDHMFIMDYSDEKGWYDPRIIPFQNISLSPAACVFHYGAEVFEGLKAYRRKVVKSIEVYGEMHRFIPILAKQAGFRRIGEKVVEHHARKYGCSKFGLERTVKGYLDLITVLFMTHFGRSPMYFFGSLGTLMFLIGGGTTVWIIAAKIWKQVHGLSLRPVTDQPLFYLAILAVILGVQLFLAGFLGELINRGSSDRNKYLIDKTL